MTTALVTGAGGFLGSHVVAELLAATDWNVVATDSFRHNGTSEALAQVATPRVRVARHDLSARFSHLIQASYIVSVASRCSVDESITDPAAFISNNVEAAITVCELARRVQPRLLVHMSTDEVYGPFSPRCEADHRPSSPYAASKAAQEDIINAYARTYGIPAVVVNSANLCGERQSQLAFIPKLIRAAHTGEIVKLHTEQWGGEAKPGTRWYTYAPNVADYLVKMLTNPVPQLGGCARAALRGQQAMSNVEAAEAVSRLTGKKVFYELVDGHAARPGYDQSYATLRDMDWQPRVSFGQGLKSTVEWYQAHPEWLGL